MQELHEKPLPIKTTVGRVSVIRPTWQRYFTAYKKYCLVYGLIDPRRLENQRRTSYFLAKQQDPLQFFPQKNLLPSPLGS